MVQEKGLFLLECNSISRFFSAQLLAIIDLSVSNMALETIMALERFLCI